MTQRSPARPHQCPHAAHLVATQISTRLDRLAERVVLFRCGRFVFVTFGSLAGLGTLLALAAMGVILVGQGVAPWVFAHLALWSAGAVVVGSWLLAQVLEWRAVLADPVRALRRPVFVSWGGLAGLLAVLALLAYLSDVPVLLLLDAGARTIPLGHALGRLGCLTYGCCFGRRTDWPLAITYRSAEAKAVRVAGLDGVPLHPAALYEALMDLGILALTNAASLAGAPLGVPFVIALLVYGAGRFAIEFLRDHRHSARVPFARHASAPSLPLSQWICAGLVIFGGLLLPALLAYPAWAPAVHLHTAMQGVPELLPGVALPALVVFLGFSVHRDRVGEW